MQMESIKMQTAAVTTETKTAHLTSMESARCYECDGFGHMSKNFPRFGSGKKMCFECKEYTSHIAANCPQRLQRQKDGNSWYDGTHYESSNRGGRGGQGRYSGNKRKGDNVDSHCDSKRPRPDKTMHGEIDVTGEVVEEVGEKTTPPTREIKRVIIDREII